MVDLAPNTVDDYLAKITAYWRQQPDYVDVVSLNVKPYADLQVAMQSIIPAFDLDTAIGVQLDVVGLWVGITRNLALPLTGLYFSFDDPTLGLDQGVWFGPFDNTTGITSLDDESYRVLLRAKIAANQWDGTLAHAKDVLAGVLGLDNTNSLLFIQDNKDMTMTIGVAQEQPTPIVLALLTQGYLDLSPLTVKIASYQVTSVPGTPLFGFDNENELISGLDVGAWGLGYDGDPFGQVDVPTLTILSVTVQ